MPLKPVFFETPADFRAWLATNHATAAELWVGFWKKDSGKPSVTWPESVDEALCVGWIDGVRKSLGVDSYVIRFTPRRNGSKWSNVNVGRVKELRKRGRMRPAGEAAFAAREADKTGVYSYELGSVELGAAEVKRFRAHARAWKDFASRAPYYRKLCARWVTSAKRPETRERRLATLIACSAKGELIPGMRKAKRA